MRNTSHAQRPLRRALKGRLTKAQRFVLRELLARLDELASAIVRVNEVIDEEVNRSAAPFLAEAVKLLVTIPGIGERIAETVISEIGVEISRFPTDGTSSKLGRDLSWQ